MEFTRVNPYGDEPFTFEAPYPCDLDPEAFNIAVSFWRPAGPRWNARWMAPKHGVGIGRVLAMCGCEVCMAVHARHEAEAETMRERARSGPPIKADTRVDAGPVREHVKVLLGAGMNRVGVAIAAGVDRATIDRLMRPDVARVADETADKVLAVTCAGATV